MDPFSVTTACVGLLNGILGLSKQISSFVIGTRDAHKDMQAFSKELVSLQLCLESLKEERIVGQFPDKLKQSLLVIISSCSDVVDQMSSLLARHSSGSLGRRMQWSMFSRDEADRLRSSLEAHKSAIEIALSVSTIALGSDLKDDTAAIKAETSFLPAIKQDTGQISELRTEIQALRFQIMQIGQPQTETDERLNTFLDESIAYTESIVDARSALDVAPPSGPLSLDNVALTQTTTSSSDTTSIFSNPLSQSRSSISTPSIYSASTSLFEYWEPLTSITASHPNAIPLDRHAIEASHRTRKRFPKWKKDELDQILAEAVGYTGADRHSREQISKCASLLNLGAKIQHSVGQTDNVSSYGTLAREFHFSARYDLVALLLGRGARVTHTHSLGRSACLGPDPPIIIQLLLNQGSDRDAFISASVEVLSLSSLKFLISTTTGWSSSVIQMAITNCLKTGWISGIDYLLRMLKEGLRRGELPDSRRVGVAAARTVRDLIPATHFSTYGPDVAADFVRRYDEVMRTNPTVETERQLKENYLEEVGRWFPECLALSQARAGVATSASGKKKSMFSDREKERRAKLEKWNLTQALHSNRMNMVIHGLSSRA